MLTVRRLTAAGWTALTALLAVLWWSVGLGAVAWGVGLLCGAVVGTLVAVGLRRAGTSPGPADGVTLLRVVITCALAALTTESLLYQRITAWFVPLTVMALLLDAADGWVARRTRSSSAFGSRFDGESDALLILVLSVYVAPRTGAWVLSAGLARYAFAAVGWLLPWMRARLPFRYWRKVVTATVGIVLAGAAADTHAHAATTAAVVLGMALLAESFGRDVLWLWHHRVPVHQAAVPVDQPLAVPRASRSELV